MLSKPDIYNWFHDSVSSDRVDLMCNLLHLCLPFELRFLGACLEDFAHTHYASLLEYEHRANDASSYSAFIDKCTTAAPVFDQSVIQTLNIYVALLHSRNSRCANRVFKIVSSVWNKLCVELGTDGLKAFAGTHVVDDLVLLMTMGGLHPAFVFNQRVALSEMVAKCRQLLSCFMTRSMSGGNCAEDTGSISKMHNKSSNANSAKGPHAENTFDATGSVSRFSHPVHDDTSKLSVSTTCSTVSCTSSSSPRLNDFEDPYVTDFKRTVYTSPVRTASKSRQASPRSTDGSIAGWLKDVRLHKYKDNLSKYTWKQLMSLTDADLIQEGLTSGARKKFCQEIEARRELMNSDYYQSSSRSPPVTDHPSYSSLSPSPRHACLHRVTLPASSSISLYSHGGSGGDVDSSCSDFSSPPDSPDRKLTSSASLGRMIKSPVNCRLKTVSASFTGEDVVFVKCAGQVDSGVPRLSSAPDDFISASPITFLTPPSPKQSLPSAVKSLKVSDLPTVSGRNISDINDPIHLASITNPLPAAAVCQYPPPKFMDFNGTGPRGGPAVPKTIPGRGTATHGNPGTSRPLLASIVSGQASRPYYNYSQQLSVKSAAEETNANETRSKTQLFDACETSVFSGQKKKTDVYSVETNQIKVSGAATQCSQSTVETRFNEYFGAPNAVLVESSNPTPPSQHPEVSNIVPPPSQAHVLTGTTMHTPQLEPPQVYDLSNHFQYPGFPMIPGFPVPQLVSTQYLMSNNIPEVPDCPDVRSMHADNNVPVDNLNFEQSPTDPANFSVYVPPVYCPPLVLPEHCVEQPQRPYMTAFIPSNIPSFQSPGADSQISQQSSSVQHLSNPVSDSSVLSPLQYFTTPSQPYLFFTPTFQYIPASPLNPQCPMPTAAVNLAENSGAFLTYWPNGNALTSSAQTGYFNAAPQALTLPYPSLPPEPLHTFPVQPSNDAAYALKQQAASPHASVPPNRNGMISDVSCDKSVRRNETECNGLTSENVYVPPRLFSSQSSATTLISMCSNCGQNGHHYLDCSVTDGTDSFHGQFHLQMAAKADKQNEEL